MTGFIVLRNLAELDSIASTVRPGNPPEMALLLACRAHYPGCALLADAVVNAHDDFATNHVVLAAGDALDRIRAIADQRRATIERRAQSAPYRQQPRQRR